VRVEVRRATEAEQSIIDNLSQFYIYEFGPLNAAIQLRPDGLYKGFDGLERYWRDPTLHPFLIFVDRELAGFALVAARRADQRNNIDQFFILRKFMGRGAGRAAAKALFDLFPGKWQVTQIRKNYAAQAFWRSVLAEYTKDTFHEHYDENRRSIQEFDNSLPAS
jgi:predicted acetyltransferase